MDSQSTADDGIYTDEGTRTQSGAGAMSVLAGEESRGDNRSAAVAAEGSAWGLRRAAVASQQRWHIEQQLRLQTQVLYNRHLMAAVLRVVPMPRNLSEFFTGGIQALSAPQCVFEPQLFFVIQHARHPNVHDCRDFEGIMKKDSDVFKFQRTRIEENHGL